MDLDEAPLAEPEDRMGREDPRVARACGSGPPQDLRDPRRWPGWLLMGVAVMALSTGIALGHGLLIAAGLVMAGIGVHLLDHGRGTGGHAPGTRHPDRR
ncbi:DUF3040 domain-containing protein [Actinopolymorpha sp. B9G3]|uniref:DUF3040 domain-containing protein n=1 Tax=Actinopolymorpha sp. B9G3 TaxID=3158970 RepID=UPI0032D9A82C